MRRGGESDETDVTGGKKRRRKKYSLFASSSLSVIPPLPSGISFSFPLSNKS